MNNRALLDVCSSQHLVAGAGVMGAHAFPDFNDRCDVVSSAVRIAEAGAATR
jgi:hypothetical protein